MGRSGWPTTAASSRRSSGSWRFRWRGRARDAFVRGLRSVRCREHVIFYLPGEGGTVVVQRILHGARNAEALRWDGAEE